MFGGYDRYIYAEVFDSIADVTDSRGSYLLNQCFDFFPSEKGYTLLNISICLDIILRSLVLFYIYISKAGPRSNNCLAVYSLYN